MRLVCILRRHGLHKASVCPPSHTVVALARARLVTISVPMWPSAPVTTTTRPLASTNSPISVALTPALHLYGHGLDSSADGVGGDVAPELRAALLWCCGTRSPRGNVAAAMSSLAVARGGDTIASSSTGDHRTRRQKLESCMVDTRGVGGARDARLCREEPVRHSSTTQSSAALSCSS
eukprot:scaffold518_cov388-Prasinococcus_capsulatus_cf.AAC.43